MASNTLISFDHLLRVLDEYRAAVLNLYRDRLKTDDHVASGDLIDKLICRVKQGNREVEIDLQLRDYWKYIEEGTKPHWPPIDAIVKWIKVKNVLPTNTYDGKLPTERQLAYLIARKISEKGTEGTHDLRDALREVNQMFETRIGEAVAEDIEGVMTSILTEFQVKP